MRFRGWGLGLEGGAVDKMYVRCEWKAVVMQLGLGVEGGAVDKMCLVNGRLWQV